MSNILNTEENFSYREPAPEVDSQAFMKVVRSRRSVRKFTRDPIPESVMRECLEAAILAPNSSNLQPWEFYWVRSPEKRQKLVEACLSQNAAKTAAEIIVCVARTQTWKRNSKRMVELLKNLPPELRKIARVALPYYEKLVPLSYGQGPFGIFGFFKRIVVSVVGLFRPVPREPMSLGQMKTWAVKSTALGCENLMLALRAFGFDSCPMEGMDSARVKKILGLPRSSVIVMVVGAGKRSDVGVYGPQTRFDIKDFVFEV